MTSALISTDTLNARLGEHGLVILDATYHVPPSPRDAASEFEQMHIPGAGFFDIDRISESQSSLPHMLPSAEAFEQHMMRLGVGANSIVVVYDAHGIMSAPRLWWMLRYFGHDRVLVLDGGLPKWLAENRLTQSKLSDAEPLTQPSPPFKARVRPELLCTMQHVRKALGLDDAQQDISEQVVDMRSAGRFSGKDPEPRIGLPSGHMPGSVNAPWVSWLTPDKTLLPVQDIEAQCIRLGLNPVEKVIATCGSGVTACVGALAFYELGNCSVAVYDGSWAEWASTLGFPVSTLNP